MKKRTTRRLAAAAAIVAPGVVGSSGIAQAGPVVLTPTANTTVGGQSVTIFAQYSASRPVASVKVFIETTLIAERQFSPATTSGNVTINWDSTRYTAGSHTLSVKCYDRSGQVIGVQTVPISVANATGPDMIPPQVAILSPAPNTEIEGTLDVRILASDNSGQNPYVSLFVNKRLKAVSNRQPYTFSVDTTRYTNGVHNVEAWAYDAESNRGVSNTISFRVNNPGGATTMNEEVNRLGETPANLEPAPATEAPLPVVAAPRPLKPTQPVTVLQPVKSVEPTPVPAPVVPVAAPEIQIVDAPVVETSDRSLEIQDVTPAVVETVPVPVIQELTPVPSTTPVDSGISERAPSPDVSVEVNAPARVEAEPTPVVNIPPVKSVTAQAVSPKKTSTVAQPSPVVTHIQPERPAPISAKTEPAPKRITTIQEAPIRIARADVKPPAPKPVSPAPREIVFQPERPVQTAPAVRLPKEQVHQAAPVMDTAVTPPSAATVIAPAVTIPNPAPRPLRLAKAPQPTTPAVRMALPAVKPTAFKPRETVREDKGQNLKPIIIPEILPDQARDGRILHTVRPGESPASLAKSYGVPLKRLMASNDLGRRTRLRAGQEVQIPSPVRIALNNQVVPFDVAPRIVNGSTLAPVRNLLESLGGRVSWNAHRREVRASGQGLDLRFNIGSRIAYVNGQAITLDAPVTIVDGRTIVPIRFLVDSLRLSAEYDLRSGQINLFRRTV